MENREFENYKNSLVGHSCGSSDIAFKQYQKARDSITKDMRKLEHDKWKTLTNGSNSKNFWQSIDWKGNMSKCDTSKSTIEDLASHFEDL